jgi:hypothetical protein
MMQLHNWRSLLVKGLLFIWGLQIIWLAWYFTPEVQDLAWRVSHWQVGAAIRREDPFFQWCTSLASLIPRHATYVFLDNYEAGKEIQARYVLSPRRHILLSPDVPASFLFYSLRREKASFLLIRNQEQGPAPALSAIHRCPAFQPVHLPGPGLVFRVDYRRLQGDFYD